jgi:hypothetical protein
VGKQSSTSIGSDDVLVRGPDGSSSFDLPPALVSVSTSEAMRIQMFYWPSLRHTCQNANRTSPAGLRPESDMPTVSLELKEAEAAVSATEGLLVRHLSEPITLKIGGAASREASTIEGYITCKAGEFSRTTVICGSRAVTQAPVALTNITCSGLAGIVPIVCPPTRLCVFWNATTRSWSDNGCRTLPSDSPDGATICQCDHLTDFSGRPGRKVARLGRLIIQVIHIWWHWSVSVLGSVFLCERTPRLPGI